MFISGQYDKIKEHLKLWYRYIVSKKAGDAMKDVHLDFQIESMQGIPVGRFPLLTETGLISHGFSTREGGISQGAYWSLNLSYSSDDDSEKVWENLMRFTLAAGVDLHRAVLSHQTHESRVKRVTKEDSGKGLVVPRDYQRIDGLITNEPGIPLMTFHADCVPVFFVDPVNVAVGLAHAGWRGTADGLLQQMIHAMQRSFGSKPQNLLAAMGPSIRACCFWVQNDVKTIITKKLRLDHSFFQVVNQRQWSLSLQAVNRQIMLEAGIPEENIIDARLCTCCNKEIYFSHRGQGAIRGTLAAVIQINGIEGKV